jgi:hypothetical protein
VQQVTNFLHSCGIVKEAAKPPANWETDGFTLSPTRSRVLGQQRASRLGGVMLWLSVARQPSPTHILKPFGAAL